MDRRVFVVVVCVAILLVVPVLASWQQWGLWRYSTNGTPNSVAISSDGSYLAVGVGTGPQNGKVLLFDKTGSLLWSHDTDRVIVSVAIATDGSYIAAAGYQLIDPKAIFYENGAIYYLARNGSLLWNYTTAPAPNSGGLNVPIFQIGLSSDGTKIIADTGNSVMFLDNHGQLIWTHLSSGGLSHTLMSFDGTYVATVDDRARAFDSQGRSLWNSSIIPPVVQNIAMSPDGRYLAVDRETNPNNGTLYLFNKTGGQLRSQAFDSPPSSITFSADDSTMVVGTQYNVIAFDSNGKTLWKWTTPSGSAVSSLAATSDGSYVLVGIGAFWEQTIFVLNGQGNVVWGKPVDVARQIALSSDGSYTAIASWSPSSSTTSFAGGSIYLLPGPRALARDTGPVYSLLYFGQNTGLIPSAILLPVAISATLIAVTVVRSRNRAEKNPGAKPESPRTFCS